MKRCPQCQSAYTDDSLNYCLADGSLLSGADDPDATLVLPTPGRFRHSRESVTSGPEAKARKSILPYLIVGMLALIIGGGAVALLRSSATDPPTRSSSKETTAPGSTVTSDTITPITPTPLTSAPNCVVSYSSGSCWTITPSSAQTCSPMEPRRRSVTVKQDGTAGTLVVSGDAAKGVRAADNSGHQFLLRPGEWFEIQAEGTLRISNDLCGGPEGIRGWYDPYVDSPFKQNVGGLEFSIGDLGTNRFFAGSHWRGKAEAGGVPTFRIIDRQTGYSQTYGGGFNVTIRKLQ